MKYAFLAALLSLIAAVPANAASWAVGTIDKVEVSAAGSLIVFLTSDTVNECGSKRADYVSLLNDVPSRAILASLLAWQAQEKQVSIYIQSYGGSIGIFSTVVNGSW